MNDLMLVETFSSGRKCKNSSWSNSSGHLPSILGTSSEIFGKSLFSEKYDPVFFFNRKCGNLGKKICRVDTEKKKKTGSIASLVCTYDFIVGVSQ